MLAISQRVGGTFRSFSVVLVAFALACCVERTDGDGDGIEDDASSAVDATRSGTGSAASAAAEETGTAPSPSSSGQIESCSSTTWGGPSEAKREAACIRQLDPLRPALPRYVCSCDVSACPLYIPDDEGPEGPPSVRLNDCVVDGVASGCDASLRAACGSSAGQHGYCERQYDGLTPTRPQQSPPPSATLVCFTQPDGTHACHCPDAPELVPTPETDCPRALLTACQTPCNSAAGECAPTDAGYDCTCTAGFQRSAEIGLCDYALFHACEPQCSNEMGACYWDPAGGPDIICRCNGDVEPRTLRRDPDVRGDECRTPLVDTCGGSFEGSSAWPQ